MAADLDITRLVWMKNVNHPVPERWAYLDGDKQRPPEESPPRSSQFRMHWPADAETNARRARKGDLMLLCQRSRASHVVRLVDGGPVHEPVDPEYPWVRSVETLWFAPRPEQAPLQQQILGFDPVFMNGRTRSLDNCVGFRNRWVDAGGVPALQQHIARLLQL